MKSQSVRRIPKLLIAAGMALAAAAVAMLPPPALASTPPVWSYETVKTIPANGCTGNGIISGFAFDPLGQPVVGWDEPNGCSSNGGVHWWGRRPADPAAGAWTNNPITHSYACGMAVYPPRGASSLSISPTGDPFMVYEDVVACGDPANAGSVRADLNRYPNGPGGFLELTGAFTSTFTYNQSYASGFSGGVPHWVTMESPVNAFAGAVRFDGRDLSPTGGRAISYAGGPGGANHVLYIAGTTAYHSTGSGVGTVVDPKLNRFANSIAVTTDAAGGVHAVVPRVLNQPGCDHLLGDGDPGCLLYEYSADGVSWTPTVLVPNEGTLSNVGTIPIANEPSIAIDPFGQPCLAYVHGPLWLTCRGADGTWIKSQISDSTQTPATPRLAFDPAGNPVVAFADNAGHKIVLAKGSPLTSHQTVTQVTAPSDGSTVAGVVAVSAAATAAPGTTLSNLAVLIDGAQLQAGPASPLNVSWDITTLPNGTHTIQSTATDSGGGTARSALTTVTVRNGPATRITAPIAGAVLSGTATVTATATPAPGTTLTSLSVQIDRDLARAVGPSPQSFAWDTTGVANGPHTITATAVDSDGASSTSTLTVTIANRPAVQVTSPADGAVLTGLVTVSATASPAAGATLSRLGISAGPTELGHGTTSAQSSVWDTTLVDNGTYQITATAIDSDGLSSTSAVTVTVKNPPTIRVLTPPTVQERAQIGTDARPARGTTLSSVVVSIDGQAPLTADASGFVYWETRGLANGPSHQIVATATDSDGGRSVSAPVTVTIANPPTVTLVASPPVTLDEVSGIVTLTATATPALGTTLSWFAIIIDNHLVTPTAGVSPLTYSWDTTGLALGSMHTFYAGARDSDGVVGNAPEQLVTVRNLPAVQIVDPPNGAVVSGVQIITATATAPRGTTLSSLTIKVNGRQLVTGATSPQTVLLNTNVDPNGTVYSIIATAVDADFGRADSAEVRLTVSDTSAPTTTAAVTPASNPAGWNRDSVSVALTATDPDGIGDIANIDYSATGAQPIAKTSATGASASISITAEGVTLLTYLAYDRKGNTEALKTLTIRIDRTAPTVTYSGNAGTYTVDQMVDITCSATDSPVNGSASGVATSTCQDVHRPAYSFNVGSNTVTATATDNAGNTGSGSATFTVSVTPDSLCSLTKQFVEGSTKFKTMSARAQLRTDRRVTQFCRHLQSPPPALRAKVIRMYQSYVHGLHRQGYLTPAEDAILTLLAYSL